MANTFNTAKSAGIIAESAAVMFEENLRFCKSIQKANVLDFKGKNGYGAGDTVYIDIPPVHNVLEQFDITGQIQPSAHGVVPLKLDILASIPLSVDSLEFAYETDLEHFINNDVRSAMVKLAANVENRMIAKATDAVYNTVGSAGSTVFDTKTMGDAKQKLREFLCPEDDESYALLNPAAMNSAVDARKSLFQRSNDIAEQYRSAYVGTADGFNYMHNSLLNIHTNGNDVSGVTVSTTATEGASSIVLTGLTANTGTITKGTVFTIAGVNPVHPLTKVAYPYLQQFTVTEDVTAGAGGTATVNISPTLYTATSKGLQNISALPASTAVVTFVGSASTAYTQNLAYHRDAFRIASVPLKMPKASAVEAAEQRDVGGLKIAFIRFFDGYTREWVTRIDFLGGLAIERPEWAVRLPS